MKAIVICRHLNLLQVEEALTLGGYQIGNQGICSTNFQMFRKADEIRIEFEDAFDFCQMIFLTLDLVEVSRETNGEVLAFVDTDFSSKITEYLQGERVCLYLSPEIADVYEQDPDEPANVLDIVTSSNRNYTIDILDFFSYTSPDRTPFEEPFFDRENWELVRTGVYLYEEGDFENEFLEDLRNENRSVAGPMPDRPSFGKG